MNKSKNQFQELVSRCREIKNFATATCPEEQSDEGIPRKHFSDPHIIGRLVLRETE